MNSKKIIQIIVILLVLGVLIYGLAYAPFQQKKISEANNDLLNKIFIISDQAIKLAEIKDVKQCQLFAGQQLAIAENTAEKDNKTLSDEEKEQIANNAYLNCLSVSGRDYIVNNILQEQKKAENKNNQSTQPNQANSTSTPTQ